MPTISEPPKALSANTPDQAGRRVLVVEDEFMLAAELADQLHDAGMIVVGPASTLTEGQMLSRSTDGIDGAVLDISLHGQMVFPLAEELLKRNIPFVFATGYDGGIIPGRFDHIERHSKPVYVDRVIAAINSAMDSPAC